MIVAKGESAPPEGTPGTQPAQGISLDEERVVRCRRCGHALAKARDRLPLDGAQTRSFVNPAGLVYEIAAFREAPGCAAEGEPSSYWTWFPGHAWQVALCGRCGTHVGWAFSGASRFFGLLVERVDC